MITPIRVYDYDMTSQERTLRKRQEVPGYDPTQYVTERQWAIARDGVKVPLSIAYRKGMNQDGSAPLYPLWLRLLRRRHVGQLQQQPDQPDGSGNDRRSSPTSAAATRWARPGTTTACS